MPKNANEGGLTSKLIPRKALNLIGKRGRLSHAVKTASLLIGLKNRIIVVVVPQASTKGLLSPSDECVSESDLLHCSQNLKAATIYSNNVMTANEFVKFNNQESNN